MTEKEFTERIAEIVSASPGAISAETKMTDIPGWDSVTLLSTMILIDSELGVTIRPEVLSRAATFGDILNALSGKLTKA